MQSLSSLFDYNDTHDYRDDRWQIPYGSDSRLAYRRRLGYWLLMIFSGAGGMPVYSEPGQSKLALIASLCEVPELADAQASVSDVRLAVAKAVQVARCLPASAPDSEPGAASIPAVGACSQRCVVDWLSDNAGLNWVERDIFEFCVAMRCFAPLRIALASWGNLSHGDLINGLSAVLGHSDLAVGLALQASSDLVRCGLLRVSYYEETVDIALKVPSKLSQRIPLHRDDPALILSHLVNPMPEPRLTLAHFEHMQQDTQLMQCWLAGALHAATQGQSAGHALVSGAPGLGKTEWVRALLKQAQVRALELGVLEEDGSALSGEDRLSHLRLAMRLLRSTPKGVLVFDEADDVFRNQHESGADGDKEAVSMANHRASLNRLIEDSQVPVIWIMNHPDILDAAVLRRFDAVITFRGIPRSVRLNMLADRGVGSEAEIKPWADISSLTPSLIDRLASVKQRAHAAGQDMDANLCSHWLRHRLPGKPTQHLKLSNALNALTWGAEFVNASEDLLAIADGIRRCGSARILLYGAPGTGKTAYAHALAQMLDRPLLEQRASDLLSPYVGETEQRINQAFMLALEDAAVLLIDEADSLLASREGAVRNWEVTQVNELLEQLGEFQGVVVLATNRLEALDAAVLRRLDAKILFETLKPQQIQKNFSALCLQLNIACSETDLQAAGQLKLVTPGDFACVARRLAFAPIEPRENSTTSPAQALLALLKAELKLKSGNKQAMGFGLQQE